MDIYIKAVSAALITVVLCLVVAKRDKDMSLLLTMVGCCMLATVAVIYLEPVFAFFRQLQSMSDMDPEILGILLKSVGIGLLSEIVGLICADVGNSALGKVLQIVAVALILWISLPLLTALMDLVGEILGEI